jgi:hypothetical protein
MLEDGYERMVGLGLLGVITFLAWPIWLMIAAAEHQFTTEVALSALIPTVMTLFWVAIALRVPARISRHWHHGTHALGDHLHGGSHRHA